MFVHIQEILDHRNRETNNSAEDRDSERRVSIANPSSRHQQQGARHARKCAVLAQNVLGYSKRFENEENLKSAGTSANSSYNTVYEIIAINAHGETLPKITDIALGHTLFLQLGKRILTLVDVPAHEQECECIERSDGHAYELALIEDVRKHEPTK